MNEGLAGVEQRRQRQVTTATEERLQTILDDYATQLQELLRTAIPLVELPECKQADRRFEYRCQHGDGIIRHCTPQQAKQAVLLGRPVEQRSVTDWVEVQR